MQIRARSTIVREVAGVAFDTIGEWIEMELEKTIDHAKVLCGLTEDPFVQVQVDKAEDDAGEDWQPGPSIEEARSLVKKTAAAEKAAATKPAAPKP